MEIHREWRLPYSITPIEVLKDTKLSLQARTVYSYLCHMAIEGSTVEPIKAIAKDLGIGSRQAIRYMNELKDRGLVVAKKRGPRETSQKILSDPSKVYGDTPVDTVDVVEPAEPKPAPRSVISVTSEPRSVGSVTSGPTKLNTAPGDEFIADLEECQDVKDQDESTGRSVILPSLREGRKNSKKNSPPRARLLVEKARASGETSSADRLARDGERLAPWVDASSAGERIKQKRRKRKPAGCSKSGRENCHDLLLLWRKEFAEAYPHAGKVECSKERKKDLHGFSEVIEVYGFETAYKMVRVVIWSWCAMRELYKLKDSVPAPFYVYTYREQCAGVINQGFITRTHRRNRVMNDWESSEEAAALRKKDIWMGIFDDEERAIAEDFKRLSRPKGQ